MSYKVSAKRHLGKTISYRIISTFVGFLIMWYMTGSIKFGAAFGVAEIVLKPIIYYFHERIWYRRIKFGLVEEKKHKLKKVQLNENELNDVKPEVKQYQENIVETIKPQLPPHPIPSPTKMLREDENPKKSEKKVLNYSSNR